MRERLGTPGASRRVAEVVFAYSDVSHEAVMHAGSRALAVGADFVLLGTGFPYRQFYPEDAKEPQGWNIENRLAIGEDVTKETDDVEKT